MCIFFYIPLVRFSCSASDSKTLGSIGSITNTSPSIWHDQSRFYLNAENPASASGIISSLGYCHYVPNNIESGFNVFQATVGFYRRTLNDNFRLVSDIFNISVNTSTLLSSGVYCGQLEITPVEIQQDDVIGVCSREFPQNSVGVLQLVSSDGPGADQELLRSDTTDDLQQLCSGLGLMPQDIHSSDLDRRQRILHLSANITSECLKDIVEL